MNNIVLKRIDESNFIDCFNLKLAVGQEKYVSNPIRSLAQAYVYYSQCTPFGIYVEDKMVGYVMVIYDYDEEVYNIWHMMIDKEFQGNGYGKGALKEVLRYISSKPFGQSQTVFITCNPENTIAYGLYRQLGFMETGRSDDDELELGITL
ncbi:GNAT family N-acetyltransferase [Murimonas intestini]|uniref:Diamine N-acetyltransferase n=1 Tax=Murimonas intestini TaxID=1337051 RepID=A0AB73T1N4_9FIRM|nr:GNAT family N-acetyltransferase [Murimonas intestini]MCR1842606.1 GNAT family N-acetyltransferase [Murimonas intestini]MCR1867347.1 GNAT family N-acetyltransferase [Murimonas intestini]MCR1884534.1 GNAT family N-acetyltransferase [Murimonas intestini]